MTPMDFDKDWNPQLALKRRTNHLHSPKRRWVHFILFCNHLPRLESSFSLMLYLVPF
jgi:hypothetical protein